jgi:Cft2 family RNA processing exonuclease
MEIDGSGIRVDGFGVGGRAYFLSHLHSDHTSGLGKNWRHGPLYCSALTARLLSERFGLDGETVNVLEPGRPVKLRLDGTELQVSAIDANHCPGAVMFHFQWPDRSVLYTGDFRLNDDIRTHAQRLSGVDVAYVDGTYDNPRYVFPSQEDAIDQVLALVAEHMNKKVFLAVYSIGKTRVVQAVVREFGMPVYASENVLRLYRAMGLGELVTRDSTLTNLHGYARGYYYNYFRYRHRRFRRTHVVIIPTGWAVDVEDDPHGYIHVPYSEHCDYRELREFRELLRPGKLIPI